MLIKLKITLQKRQFFKNKKLYINKEHKHDMALHGDYSYGQSFIQDDQKFTVISSSFASDYITVQDEQGNVIRQKKNLAILSFQAEQQAEREEQIAYFQNKAKEAETEKFDWMKKIKDLYSQMSDVGKNNPEYSVLKKEYWAPRFAKVAAGNRGYSASLYAFMIASGPIA